MTYMAGGTVSSAENSSEYGKIPLSVDTKEPLFQGVPEKSVCWMSHNDFVNRLPEGFTAIAHTEKCVNAAIKDGKRRLYGVQFHPEVTHTEFGKQILKNFVYGVCGCKGDWRIGNFVSETIEEYKAKLGGKKVYARCRAGWTVRSPRLFFIRRWAKISCACSLTTGYFARTKAISSRRLSAGSSI